MAKVNAVEIANGKRDGHTSAVTDTAKDPHGTLEKLVS